MRQAIDRGAPHAPALPTVYRAGLGRRLPAGFIRVGPLSAIPQTLQDLGIDADAVMVQAGVPPAVFGDPDNAMSFHVLAGLLALSTQATGRDDFGLLIADRTKTSSLGIVGFLMQQAPSVRTALTDLVRYLHHHDRGGVPHLAIENGTAAVSYLVIEPNVPAIEQIYDLAMAIAFNILRGLCGAAWAPKEVTLSRRRPPLLRPYERVFCAPVRFNAECSAILFPEHWLDTPIETADAALRRMLQEQVDLLDMEEAGQMSEEVRRLLRTALLTHSGSFEDLAAMVGINKRTLARRLEAEGTSFRELSDEIQLEVACQLLKGTAMTITEIGMALRYSETSAFSRAFRQWSGLSPRAWRQRHLAQAPR